MSSSTNPFIRYRKSLDSYTRARGQGWTDTDYVALVEQLDAKLLELEGYGLAVTPTTAAPELASAIGLCPSRLWLKDDTENVAGSHKIRHLFGVLLHLVIDDRCDGELAISSCGNAALAAAVIARAAERKIRVFIPAWANPIVVSQLEALHADIVVCERRATEKGDPAHLRFTEAVAEGAIAFSCQTALTPSALDGGRTLGFELAEQLANFGVIGTTRLYVQVGGGALASAVWSGLLSYVQRLGLSISPVLHTVQSTQCAPLSRAWTRLSQQDASIEQMLTNARTTPDQYMWPWEDVGMSAADGILDDVTYEWQAIVEAMLRTNGWPVTVSEAQIRHAHQMVHRHTDIDADATGTAGLAGVLHDSHAGEKRRHDHVVALVTGRTR
jgi:threonine synthase